MRKELVSGFVDSELDEKELQLLENENREKLKKLVNVYRIIGETIRHNEANIQPGDRFLGRLKKVLEQEYATYPEKSAENAVSSSDSASESTRTKEESII